ncbi:C-GCAxxG-C-C family protein [bacterium]|nr:C-GCAxxG-C-C family protein [bacterium]
MDRTQNAESKFLEGYTCSQAIVSEYCEPFNLDLKTALNLSAGFAGGMRLGKTCGAVTGALIILGLNFSGPHSEKPEDRKNIYKAASEFQKKFIEIHGSTECRDLLAVDISTAEGAQIAKDKNLFKTVCPQFVKNAAVLLESLINENESGGRAVTSG